MIEFKTPFMISQAFVRPAIIMSQAIDHDKQSPCPKSTCQSRLIHYFQRYAYR